MERQREAMLTAAGDQLAQSLISTVGAASWLSHQNAYAIEWPIKDFHQRIFSALECGHGALYQDGEAPAGFVTWAWLDEDTDRRYRLGRFALSAQERQAGTFLWLIDCLVLPSYSRSIAHQVLNDLFEPGTPIRWLTPGRAGRVVRTISGAGREAELHGNWP